MANPPIHVEQLDGSSQAGANCGMAAAAMAVNFATQGKVKPTPTQMRSRAACGNGSTNTADQQKAVQSYNTPSETGGRKPLVYKRCLQRPWSELVAAINAGHVVNLQINYRVFNKESSVTGDPNFTGNHSITVHGKRKVSAGDQYKDYDPLFDGRRSGIANGPTFVMANDLKKAAEAFAGKAGTWTGGIIKVSAKLAAPGPDPEPPKPPDPKPPTPPNREAIYLDALTKVRSELMQALAIVNGALPETVSTFAIIEEGTMDAVVEASIPVENEDDEPDVPEEPDPDAEEDD